MDSSELPLGTSCLLGCWEGWQGRKGPENWTSGEGSGTRQSPPGWGTKLLMLNSGKQGLTVPLSPAQPNPGWEPPQKASPSTECLFCFHCASDCCLLGPSRSQDLSQGSVKSRGAGRRGSRCPWEVKMAFLWQPQRGGIVPGPQSTQVQGGTGV